MPHLMLELLGRLVDVSSWHVVSKTIAVPQTNIDRAKQGTTTFFFHPCWNSDQTWVSDSIGTKTKTQD
jgi:hypothetical protein